MNTRLAVMLPLALSALMIGIAHSPIRLNYTESLPIGIWRIKPISKIERGTIVFLHEEGKRRFLKPIAAVAGDTVELRTGKPVTINGKELPNTEAQPKNTPWPEGKYTVKPGEVWVFSSYNIKSYDSRYFGPLSVSTIEGEAIPLLVMEN
jgi:Type IV secretory pathway, protease TraF